jgi:hypothetical protein
MGQMLGRAAKLIRLLEKAGMTEDDFQLLSDDLRVRTKWVKAFQDVRPALPVYMDLPEDPNNEGLHTLFHKVYELPAFEDLLSNADNLDGSFVYFASITARQELFSRLTDRERTVIILRFGLIDGRSMTRMAIGNQLNISDTRVRDHEKKALFKLQRYEHDRLYTLRRQAQASGGQMDHSLPLVDFDFSERTRNCLKRAQITTIDQLLARTEDDLLAITNFGFNSLKEVKTKLAERNLALAPERG